MRGITVKTVPSGPSRRDKGGLTPALYYCPGLGQTDLTGHKTKIDKNQQNINLYYKSRFRPKLQNSVNTE